MRLENLTAEIRPRVPWESIDLGCALARRHIGAIWKCWLVTVVPLWILLAALLWNHPWWFALVTWWLKPVYDRVSLFVVSRALFGAVPRVSEVLRAWPVLLVRRFWFALLLGRFSPARGLSMPVCELEGLRGDAYRKRVNLLERNGGEGATMATFAGMVLESVAAFGIVVLAFLMVPAAVSEQWWRGIGDFFEYGDWGEIAPGMVWLGAVVRLLSFALMEPFYVSAGFALYINSRTLTEGWDIELAFKRLSARLRNLGEGKGAALLAVCAGLFLFWFGAPVCCAQPGGDAGLDPAKQEVKEVLADDDFEIHYRIEEVPVEKSSSGGSSGSHWGSGLPAGFGDVLFVLILTAVVAALAYLLYVNRHVFSGGGGAGSGDDGPRTREVMGMEVTPESLPDDVVAAAREAWQGGRHKLALSYLYRGSIAWLVHRADVPIGESDTEGDCLRHVEEARLPDVVAYFSRLTKSWTGMAYGNEKPDEHEMDWLCDGWPFRRMERRGK